MFYMSYEIGTTAANDEDITADLKAASQHAGVANDQMPFVIVSLQLETTTETGISINGSDYITPDTVVLNDGTTTVYRLEIPKSSDMRIKTIKLEDTGVSWAATFQYL